MWFTRGCVTTSQVTIAISIPSTSGFTAAHHFNQMYNSGVQNQYHVRWVYIDKVYITHVYPCAVIVLEGESIYESLASIQALSRMSGYGRMRRKTEEAREGLDHYDLNTVNVV